MVYHRRRGGRIFVDHGEVTLIPKEQSQTQSCLGASVPRVHHALKESAFVPKPSPPKIRPKAQLLVKGRFARQVLRRQPAGGIAATVFLCTAAKLPDFKESSGSSCSAVFVLLGPLLVFNVRLDRAKWSGQREYGALAGSYMQEFYQK